MTKFDRPPLPQGCFPPNSGPPAVIDDPCSYLGELRAALYALMSGRQSHQIRFGEQWQTMNQGSVVALRAEVMRLERICPRGPSNPHGGGNHAMRAGPYAPAGSTPPSPAFAGRTRNPYRW